ncbi:hypothetical protein DFP72DRAFT_878812, partial [Ephemerocybe angulata]
FPRCAVHGPAGSRCQHPQGRAPLLETALIDNCSGTDSPPSSEAGQLRSASFTASPDEHPVAIRARFQSPPRPTLTILCPMTLRDDAGPLTRRATAPDHHPSVPTLQLPQPPHILIERLAQFPRRAAAIDSDQMTTTNKVLRPLFSPPNASAHATLAEVRTSFERSFFGRQDGHCIAWREGVELELDLGSEARRALSWVILHECAARVQNLGVRWEGNTDVKGSHSSGTLTLP